jgi:hypothetical protein
MTRNPQPRRGAGRARARALALHLARGVLLAAGLLAVPLRAQAPALPGAETTDSAEVLIGRIKEQLAAVDAALTNAAETESAAEEVAAAKRSHLSVIRDIEALIRQVKYQQSNSSSSGGKGDSSSGSSQGMSGKPQSQPSDGSSAPKPQGATGKDAQKQPEEPPGGEQPEGTTPTGAESPDRGPGTNEQGSQVPPDETGRFTRTDTDARWGVLPPKLQERLMNLQIEDVPERYRTWLEAYIHALNSREQEGRSP